MYKLFTIMLLCVILSYGCVEYKKFDDKRIPTIQEEPIRH
mgnify:CR=1 FL=1